LKPSVLITSIIVGLLVTVVAGSPGSAAARIPPIAALRDMAIDRSAKSRVRLVLGTALTVVGWASSSPQ